MLGCKYALQEIYNCARKNICFSKLSVLLEPRSRKTVSLLGTDNVRGQISEHISAPNGGYRLFKVLSGKITMSDSLDVFFYVPVQAYCSDVVERISDNMN